jgi:hypothetical protein
VQLALGRIELRQHLAHGHGIAEFQVFSQWGEDGIIADLTTRVPIGRRTFIEFGVENYREANTRFLLLDQNWSGLVMDGSAAHIQGIREIKIYWKYDLDARQAFVTRENIDTLLREAGMKGDLGVLSIDIDGNDYWVWQGISVVDPRIVVIEYNSIFGSERAVTVPYHPDFKRGAKHSSNLYYGSSIAALERLGREKGYALVAGNAAGNNAFFVKNELLGSLEPISAKAAWREARFRESRNDRGQLTFLGLRERLNLIASMPVHDLDTGREVLISSLGLGEPH